MPGELGFWNHYVLGHINELLDGLSVALANHEHILDFTLKPKDFAGDACEIGFLLLLIWQGFFFLHAVEIFKQTWNEVR